MPKTKGVPAVEQFNSAVRSIQKANRLGKFCIEQGISICDLHQILAMKRKEARSNEETE